MLDPLGLDHTSTRISFPGTSAAHHWIGDGQWDTTSLKSDPLMHAAGGMVSSSDDMAKWLLANLERPEVIGGAVWADAQTAQVSIDRKSASLDCQGYALGWNVCELSGHTVLVHGGGYSGARTTMAVAPQLGVGVAVMANSDSMTGELGERLARTFLELASIPDAVAPNPSEYGQDYAARLSQQLESRRLRVLAERADASWGGWTWHPSGAELDAYVGRYRGDLGDLVVVREGDHLRSSLGKLARTLEPALPDLFGAQADPFGSIETMKFTRDSGRLNGLVWGGERYERLEANTEIP